MGEILFVYFAVASVNQSGTDKQLYLSLLQQKTFNIKRFKVYVLCMLS